jgi:hypothetical protein
MSEVIKRVNGILWEDINTISGISAASVISMSGAPAPPPIQFATLSATKYGSYTRTSTISWTLAVNSIISNFNSTGGIPSLAINSQVQPTRTGTNNINTRINLQFDLSSYSAYTILSASLKLDVGGINTTATPNEVFVLDLGDTFDFPTLNNANYSLVYQSGSLTEYATDTVSTTGIFNLNFNATALATASTYPAAYSMALLTYQDRQDVSPGSYNQYIISINGTPELEITYQ